LSKHVEPSNLLKNATHPHIVMDLLISMFKICNDEFTAKASAILIVPHMIDIVATHVQIFYRSVHCQGTCNFVRPYISQIAIADIEFS
jgi:hypothetical protein